jgi:hypothetical protein
VRWDRLTEGGGLAVHFRGEAYSVVCFAGMVEESRAEKCSEMVMLMLPPLYLFIQLEARQAAKRLLRNRFSYMSKFG